MGRVKPYQFEDENFISNQMIGQEAVEQEIGLIRGIDKRDENEQNRKELVIRSNNSTNQDNNIVSGSNLLSEEVDTA